MNEDQLEQLCLNWFEEKGYTIVNGKDIAPESDSPDREDYREVILKSRLLSRLKLINPDIPHTALEEAVIRISKPETPILIKNNRIFHKYLIEGVSVQYRQNDEIVDDYVRLIDFSKSNNNEFLVVNQFSVSGTNKIRRPDIVVFVNGLPVAVIELKNPADENADVWDAYNQLQTYKEEISELFTFNEAMVISDGMNGRIGSLTASKEWFMPWRTILNEDDRPEFKFQLETIVKGFFDKQLFLDYIRYFVLFEVNGDNIVKKIAGYHQFHAVREAVNATITASRLPDKNKIDDRRAPWGKEVEPGSKKAGVVWHTQGSGKSISMVCYAGKLLQQREMNNPTIIIVTDRNDLDGQLFDTFKMSKDTLKQTPVQADGREELRETLAARQAGGIIFTTIQKFSLLNGEEKHPVLNSRNNIVVISDEAHRSQYGEKAKLNTATGKYTFGYSKHLRDSMPNATFLGFTGTPISMDDKDTRAVFGGYVSIYDIQDAVDDGSTVPIYYEARLAKLDINRDEIDELNNEVEEVIEDEEDLSVRESTKSRWAALEKLVGSEPRIKQVAKDLVNHFTSRTETFPGKAMIVCMSREICVAMFNAIVELKPEWQGKLNKESVDKTGYYDANNGTLRVVMTGSASDRSELQKHLYNKQQKKQLEKRFKDSEDELKLVIVRDMWLTGFDAPVCHTMYVDKPMKGHNLMQAIARVNRVFKDKPGGLVVDYIGIANELKQALKDYTDANGRGEPAIDSYQAYAILIEKMDVVRGMFHGFDYSDFELKALQLLPLAMDHILGLDDGKKRFSDAVAAISKAYTLCGTLEKAEALKKEIAFFSAVKSAISKYTSVDKKQSEAEQNSVLKQIIDNAIIANGVADVFKLAGLEKPNIGLLSDDFLEDVKNMPQKNLAVSLLERLLKDQIKSRMKNDVVQEKKYSDRIIETLRKYNNRSVETAQVIEELIQMAKDMEKDEKLAEKSGLNTDEIAFYRALIQNESAVRQLGDIKLRELAKFITEKLKSSTTVDWQVRDSVRAKLRILVKRALKKWKYPPDKSEEAVTLVLQQAEVLSEHWAH
ncbi:MAG: type I restriction endonuclease subunit R [Bacteroidota bacterium]